MATPLGIIFSTDEKAVAQANLKLLRSTVESLVKFDQEKFEQLLSSGSISPKAMRKYRKVPSKTRSLASSKTFQRKAPLEINRTLFDRANSSTSLDVHASSFGANTACNEVSQEARKTSAMAQG